MFISRLSILACASGVLFASALGAPHESHDHSMEKRLPSTWDHPVDHPAYALFRRGAATDGATYPQVGSSTWAAAYPSSTPDPASVPKAWSDALNAAVAAGKIPDIPPSSIATGNPVYPNGFDPNGQVVCSATYKCRNAGDIWDAPEGVFGSGFDDGPLPTSEPLYDFLANNSVHATHFMIGVNILYNPTVFSKAFNNGDDIAVHTWTHPYMTTLSNADVVAQLGYTMAIIHDSTGGRLPRYWRPPYGDSDNRVRAIAAEVFGLQTIIWNQDTEDWSLTSGGTTPEKVASSLHQWITGPKSPGLIILEHELSNLSVDAFINAFPLIQQNGWQFTPVTRLNKSVPYQNSDDNTDSVTPESVGVLAAATSSASPTASSSSAASVAPTSASSQVTSIKSSVVAQTSTSSSAAVTTSGVSEQRTSSGVSMRAALADRSLAWTAILALVFSIMIVY
ncbi:glycoside hydrolase/deacetylase, partial [Punctularia strigosozonata HHB-11173 SS5]|uniref:glycoside hydrolase/deacetylase n=1 Tax=Punctularia strigosozonata (strain HHB-11173) TaxID=741275 RepID=UPI0004416B4D